MADTVKLTALADGLEAESSRAQNKALADLDWLISRAERVKADLLAGVTVSDGRLRNLVTLAVEIEQNGKAMVRAAESADALREALRAPAAVSVRTLSEGDLFRWELNSDPLVFVKVRPNYPDDRYDTVTYDNGQSVVMWTGTADRTVYPVREG